MMRRLLTALLLLLLPVVAVAESSAPDWLEVSGGVLTVRLPWDGSLMYWTTNVPRRWNC